MPKLRIPDDMALQYLDNNIVHWRQALRNADTLRESLEATNYVDAYQSVRVMFFGELKPLEEWQEL